MILQFSFSIAILDPGIISYLGRPVPPYPYSVNIYYLLLYVVCVSVIFQSVFLHSVSYSFLSIYVPFVHIVFEFCFSTDGARWCMTPDGA